MGAQRRIVGVGVTVGSCHNQKSNNQQATKRRKNTTVINFSKNENALAAFNFGHLESGRAPYSKEQVLTTYSNEK